MTGKRLPVGDFIDVGEHRLHYLSYGEGPPVVLLHGSGPGASGFSNFKQNIDAIVNAGRRALVFDMVGFGYSSKPTERDYTTTLFSTTITAALEQLGVKKCVVLGNSLGGAVAVRIALDNPDLVEGLILMAPGGIEETTVYFEMPGIKKMVAEFTAGTLDEAGLGALLRMLTFDPSVVTDALVAERYEVLQTQPREVLARLIVPSVADQLGQLKCPILGFWGTRDLFCPVSGAQRFLNACADCTFTLVSECGHWVMVERPDMFNAQMTHFLSRLKH